MDPVSASTAAAPALSSLDAVSMQPPSPSAPAVAAASSPPPSLMDLSSPTSLAALQLLNELPSHQRDCGWWIVTALNHDRLLQNFDKANHPGITALLTNIRNILNEYYVPATRYLDRVCKEEGVGDNEKYETTNPRVASVRGRYASQLARNDYVDLEIPPDVLSHLLVSMHVLMSSLCLMVMEFRTESLRQSVSQSVHVPLLIPFNHDPDRLFDHVVMSYNREYSMEHTDDIVGYQRRMPYINVGGFAGLVCGVSESRGVNASGNKFKVLNILEPSLSLLRTNFNRYMRARFPDRFPSDMISPLLFVQISEPQSVQRVKCLNPVPLSAANAGGPPGSGSSTTKIVFVVANFANVTLVTFRNQVVPQLQLWANVILHD